MPRKTSGGQRKGGSRPRSFNEAAARCRGKRSPPRTPASSAEGFNEAAARCRGKRRMAKLYYLQFQYASMRPRPDAAENFQGEGQWRSSDRCFNEAAARCRGKRGLRGWR